MSTNQAAKLTHARLVEVLRYEPESGLFFWRVKAAHRRMPGDQAGSPSKDGRNRIRIDGELFYGYRLAWLYMTGQWPEQRVDHINGNPTDDRWVNLRDVSQTVNCQNQRGPGKNNTTGLIGAQRGRSGKFTSEIRINGRRRYLGTFGTPVEAHAAYLAAKRQHHPGNTL